MRISDWSSDVCSSDLRDGLTGQIKKGEFTGEHVISHQPQGQPPFPHGNVIDRRNDAIAAQRVAARVSHSPWCEWCTPCLHFFGQRRRQALRFPSNRSEEHTSELQSLMRISYAV